MSKSVFFAITKDNALKERNSILLDDDILEFLRDTAYQMPEKYPFVKVFSRDFYEDCAVLNKDINNFVKELQTAILRVNLTPSALLWITALISACEIAEQKGFNMFCLAD